MPAPTATRARTRRLHPWPLRVMHWTNALAMFAMILSGCGIYNYAPIVGTLQFPSLFKLGGWSAKMLQWHFAAMWLLTLNGLAYLAYGVVTGRFRSRLLPIRAAEFARTMRDSVRLDRLHDDLTTYNAVQKSFYIAVIVVGASQVVTGLAIWKPVQLSELTDLLGGFQGARTLHFLGMAFILAFVGVHVLLSLAVPATLKAMVTGGPVVER